MVEKSLTKRQLLTAARKAGAEVDFDVDGESSSISVTLWAAAGYRFAGPGAHCAVSAGYKHEPRGRIYHEAARDLEEIERCDCAECAER